MRHEDAPSQHNEGWINTPSSRRCTTYLTYRDAPGRSQFNSLCGIWHSKRSRPIVVDLRRYKYK